MKSLLAGAALAGLIATAALAQTMADGPRPEGGERPHMPTTRADVEARVAEHFATFDADHDGVVTRAELEAFLARRRVEWEAKRKAHRDEEFAQLDKNKDGKLSRAEYESPPPPGDHGDRHGPVQERGRPEGPDSWRHHRPHDGMMARHWFEKLDADHDGRVTLADAKAAALAHFDRLDTNHDGTLSPDEFRAGWMRHGPGGPEGMPGPRGPRGPRPDMPPPGAGGTVRGPGYDLPAGTPPAPPPAPQTT